MKKVYLAGSEVFLKDSIEIGTKKRSFAVSTDLSVCIH